MDPFKKPAAAMGPLKKSDIWVFALFLLITEGAGAIAGILSAGGFADDWFTHLVKPSWQPPGWVFGPVWTTLYFIMAISAFRIWRRTGSDKPLPLVFFAIQLVLNLAWTPIFARAHELLLAFVEILFLDLFLILTILTFLHVDITSGLLLLPYLAWVLFATYLTYTLWKLNPRTQGIYSRNFNTHVHSQWSSGEL